MSNDLFNRYNIIKMQLLTYTKNLKEIQLFNQNLQKIIQDKFNIIKKKFFLQIKKKKKKYIKKKKKKKKKKINK